MKIGIDARSLLAPEWAGMEYHLFNLISHLAKIMTRLFKSHFPIEFCVGKLDVLHGPRYYFFPPFWLNVR